MYTTPITFKQNTMSKDYKIISQGEPKDAQKELVIEVSAEYIASFSAKTLAEFVKEAEIEGFRKGHAPEALVKERVGEFKLFEEATQRAIQELIPTIVLEEKIEAISMPHIHLTKISLNSPVEFKMHFYVMPEVELGDYKKIAQGIKKEVVELKPEEVDGYIDQILTARSTKNEGEESVKPELTDEFVKGLGTFENVDDFKAKLSENMKAEKEIQASQKRRLEIIEEVIKQTKVKLPEVLVEEEQYKMLDEFRMRVESMKMNFEEYLTTLKKTEQELMDEWKEDAVKRAKMNVILPQIASKESIKPEDADIEKEISHLKEHYKDLDENRARIYVAGVLTNEAVFKFLENL
jgi:FKBP-type peptidyl-prolyl cis-trans isomerase (trigger factor)